MRVAIAFVAAVIATYLLSVAAYTSRVIAAQAEFGATYSATAAVETFLINLAGLWQFGLVIATGLAVAFLVVGALRFVVRAPADFAIAGAVAMAVIIYSIEQILGGGAGVIGGARTPFGFALQLLSGFAGGLIFRMLRGK